MPVCVCLSRCWWACVRAPELDAKLSKFSQISAPQSLPPIDTRRASKRSPPHENIGQDSSEHHNVFCGDNYGLSERCGG